eukprot:gnl/Spiro4/29828_TR14659_c0_g1_i1.p1 gnl/Spiro4/29828_TR14659_c0_g1~~gnl/Spiro4/29828_TR14659_c0_g1_i1.p1  ORF type:complete len:150 (+),score=10.32 gnl/Spiro4/29828_TR14659_c0_g1_i1:49-498(+)
MLTEDPRCHLAVKGAVHGAAIGSMVGFNPWIPLRQGLRGNVAAAEVIARCGRMAVVWGFYEAVFRPTLFSAASRQQLQTDGNIGYPGPVLATAVGAFTGMCSTPIYVYLKRVKSLTGACRALAWGTCFPALGMGLAFFFLSPSRNPFFS